MSVTDIDKKDEYKYTITFCGGNGAAVLQKKLNPTATDSKKPVDCGKFANSTLVGGGWFFKNKSFFTCFYRCQYTREDWDIFQSL